MAMRLLVSICCIVTSSATGVWSENQFKTKYDAYVVNLDSAAVKTANANIVGEAIPADTNEKGMHRWYHDVNAAVQADAKAIMGKTLADRLAHGNYPTADCMTKINTAIGASADWATLYPIYLSVTGDEVPVVPPASADTVKAQACVHALSGAEKELAIQAGFHSKLFGYFTSKMTAALTGTLTMTKVSDFVTGTLAAAAPTAPADGKLTQPMYSQADATLRGEMMRAMVNQLNGQLPAV